MKTDELVVQLQDAWTAVEKAGLPEHVQAAGLAIAFAALAGTQPEPTSRVTPIQEAPQNNPEAPDVAPAMPSTDDFMVKLSHKTDLPEERLAKVFVIHEGKVELVPSDRRLGADSAVRFRTIAILMVPALVVLNSVDAAEGSEIKRLGEKHGAVDEGRNFAKYVKGIPGYSYVGDPRKKAFKLTPGWEDTFAKAIAAVDEGTAS